MIMGRLSALRQKMAEAAIDVCCFHTSDAHMSEYVADHFKTLAYFSGFTGSLATLLVSREDAWIFVDGRYHLQAERQCVPNGIKVVRLGMEGALGADEFICQHFADQVIGLDGRCMGIAFVKKLLSAGIDVRSVDLYSDIFLNRPELSTSPIYELDTCYTGLPRKKKIAMITYVLEGKTHIVNSLESIAYLLNLRGDDIPHTPVFLAYLVLKDGVCTLFVSLRRLPYKVYDSLLQDGVVIRPYEEYYDYIAALDQEVIILDENKVNYATYALIEGHNTIVNRRSPIDDMKSIKNQTEQQNMKLAHIYDGVAVLRFLMWLDKADKTKISEYDAACKLDACRLEYKADDLSFDSIVAYNGNAAQMHYKATAEESAMLDNKGILLFDSGGQYKEGTTDVTRTVALGEVDDEVKMYFTLVLKSMFNLSEAHFLQGLSGDQLDILARKDLWALGIDYRCGTGHGVGYGLSVHEAPPNIRYMKTESGTERVPLKPGMICSDEPGVYFEGKYGIRCENMILCRNDVRNEYGQFLSFETLTLVPFDRKLIDTEYLDEAAIKALNDYHARVYGALLPYLDKEEAEFLKGLTEKL